MQLRRGWLVQDVTQERVASTRCEAGEGSHILWQRTWQQLNINQSGHNGEVCLRFGQVEGE